MIFFHALGFTFFLDDSVWQGNIDWKQVKRSDIDFAFVRISYGLTHEDYTYDENMTNAELAGVPTGTYVYSTALSTPDNKDQSM